MFARHVWGLGVHMRHQRKKIACARLGKMKNLQAVSLDSGSNSCFGRGVLEHLVLSLLVALFRDRLFTSLLGRHKRLELCRSLPLTVQHDLRVSSQPRLARRTAPMPFRGSLRGGWRLSEGGAVPPARAKRERGSASERWGMACGGRGRVSSTCLSHSSVCRSP